VKRAVAGVMVLLAAQGAAHGAELGRLFLSADERNAIDTARQGSADVRQARARASAEPVAEQHAAVLEAPAETVTLNGYIARSAGAATVWVNGRDMLSGKLAPPARDGQRVKVPLGHSGAEVALKPGESFDPGSRQVSDAYQQRPAAER